MIGMRPGRGTDRSLLQVASGVVRALEVRPARAQEGHDDLERLLEAADHMVLGQPEGVGLLARVPGTEPEDEPPAADLVQRLDRLGGDRGIAMQGGHDPGADLHSRGRGGHGPGHRDALPPAVDRSVGLAPQQLVRDPDRVEPHRLSPEGQFADLDPARGRAVRPCFLHREHDAEFDGPHGTSFWLG